MTYKVAVTGVGGGSGQGILTALLMSKRMIDIYPVDVTPISTGLYWPGCMPGTVLPKPEEDIEAWKKWLVYNDIDLLIPGSDHDLLPLARLAEAWQGRQLPRIAVSSVQMVTIANDKWVTHQAFQAAGIPVPVSCASDEFTFAAAWAASLYPVIIKPRADAASRGLHLVHNADELLFYWKRTAHPIVQEYLDGDEYTCALYFDYQHQHRAEFAMRRWLYAGNTYRAEVVKDAILMPWLHDIGPKLSVFKPVGPINLQLRIVPGRGPVIFEINARASGSTGIRAHWGYNEADMLIRDLLDHQPITQPVTRTGFTFRHYQDIHLPGMSEAVIRDKGVPGITQAAPPEPIPAEHQPGSTTL
jgi:carbamoyl-phosphate synthase large subunit